MSNEQVAKAAMNRTGQCVMTCPTTAVFDGLPQAADRLPLGKSLRFFGDGYQKSKLIDGRRYWRVPVMDGEFVVEESIGVEKGVGGGNIILQAVTLDVALAAARRGVAAIALLAGSITPFPGGVARSGSKVGSRYKATPGFDRRWVLPHATRARGIAVAAGGRGRVRDRDRRRGRGRGRWGDGGGDSCGSGRGSVGHHRGQLRREAGEVSISVARGAKRNVIATSCTKSRAALPALWLVC